VKDNGNTSSSSSETVFFENVLDDELRIIKNHRDNRGSGNNNQIRENLTGLALSGGGIRSASFALGVLQALIKCSILKKVDYLSTVSGGGYIGCSLTWFLHKQWLKNKANILYGLDLSNFPLGKAGYGARTSDNNDILDFIRQHGNYLDPGHGLNMLSLLATILRSIITSCVVYFPLLSALMLLFTNVGFFNTEKLMSQYLFAQSIPLLKTLNVFMWISVFLICLFVVISILYTWFTYFAGSKFFKTYEFRIYFQKWMGVLLSILLAALTIGSLPIIKSIFEIYFIATASSSTAIGACSAVLHYIMVQRNEKWRDSLYSNIVIWAASIFLVYGYLMLAYSMGLWASEKGANATLLLTAAAVAAFSGLVVNINYISLNRMYRDRLMETFMPDIDSVLTAKWGPAGEANRTLLSDMCSNKTCGPYHLINTNAILVDSQGAKYRGRGGDNFILSPLYCGSDATQWCKTSDFMRGQITLSTAMAISGAAISPHTGAAGRGPSRNRLVSFLMTLINLGLGYWVNNPQNQPAGWMRPNYFYPGIKGLFGIGFHEKSAFLQLSDGGHFDNTGLYELIRRKTKIIIMSDASADPNYTFADLSNVIEKVRVDFGVNIKFEDPNTDLMQIIPVKGGTSDGVRTDGLSKKGGAIGTIEYPDFNGILFYIKSSLIPNLPTDLYGYKSAHRKFPHESTSDQFFDEYQFEAYRELGYRLARHMFEDEKHQVSKAFGLAT